MKLNQRKQLTINSGTEERIHSLTHSLVQKQAALESITAERNALRIQMEKLDVSIFSLYRIYSSKLFQTLHRATMMESRGQRPLRIDANETDDVKARVPMFMQENPFRYTVFT